MTMPPTTAANETPLNAMIMRSVRLLAGNHVLGWADQAIVSASNFLILVMIGRWTDPHQLGIYAIGVSVLALLIATQESLITRPYSIHLHHPAGAPAEHAFSALSLSVLLSAGATFVAASVALLFLAFDAVPGLVEISWALAGAIPFVLMREFARRFAFAHLAVARALLLDIGVTILTVFTLIALGCTNRLSAASAISVAGFACGFVSFAWLYLARKEFAWSSRQLASTFQRSWQMGKWFLSSQLAIQVQGYMTPWLALIIAGAAATGVYTACTSIVGFANPLLFGFFNVLLPKFVQTLRQHGAVALKRQVCLDTVLLAGVMGAFSLVVFTYGDAIMHLLYRDESYTGYGQVLVVLALAALVASVGAPASIALAAVGQARRVAGVTALAAVLNFVLIAALLPGWGLLGAAYGVLAAETVGSIGRWLAFLTVKPDAAAVRQENRLAQS